MTKLFNNTIVTAGYYYEAPQMVDAVEADPYSHAHNDKVGDGIRILTESEYNMVAKAADFDWVYTVEAGLGEPEWFDGLELHSPWLRHCSLHTAAMDLERLLARKDITDPAGADMLESLYRRAA